MASSSQPPPPSKPPASTIHATIALLIHNLTTLHDTTGAFLLHLPDGRTIDTKSWSGWEWTHGIGLYGIWKYHTLTASPSLLPHITAWWAARLADGGTTKNINTMAAMLPLACVYEATRDEALRPHLDAWGEWAMYELPRTRHGGMQHVTYLDENEGQLWDDTLMMTVLPLAKLGVVLRRPEYVEEAKRQFLLHMKYLFDAPTGLFFHGWQFTDEKGSASQGHNFARARWARGNSWLTLAIPEFIELLDLPSADPLRIHLLDTLTAQCTALAALQDGETGLWRTLLDDAPGASYVEASAAAGFAAGMLHAVRKRYLGGEFRAVAERAVRGVLSCVDEKGELGRVSFGTGMGGSLQFYREIPLTAMPYGQAMAVMALGEYARTYL